MTKKAFDKIAAGLDEAIAIARSEAQPARLHVPAELDVKAIFGNGWRDRPEPSNP
jgi:putative transcriptional regulator